MEFMSPEAAVLCVGSRARIEGLTGRPALNGAAVDVLWEAGERWAVKTDSTQETIKVRGTNLVVTGGWPGATRFALPEDDSLAQDERDAAMIACARAHQLDLVTALDLSGDALEIGDAHVEMIGCACARLETLNLEACARVSDSTVGRLNRLPLLHSLSLERCAVSDVGIAELAKGAPLESAEVTGVGELDGDTHKRSRGIYASLAWGMGYRQRGFKQLVALRLSGCAGVTDEGILKLAEGCPELQRLHLARCDAVTDRSVCALARNERLSAVVLSHCPAVSDASVCTLARSCPLEELYLKGALPDLTDFGVRALAEYRAATLTTLDVSENRRLSDAAVGALCSRCAQLRHLAFSACPRLTDAAIDAVRQGLPALESLKASGCSRLTSASLSGLREARPEVSLIVGGQLDGE